MAAISFKAMGPGEGLRPQVEPQLVKYGELKAIKDAGNLIPGQWYRITDYVTTTMQDNTQSAGHQFDILVMATGKTTLSETAFAVQHEGDEYFADSKLEAWELRYTPENVQWSQVKGITVWDEDGFPNKSAGTVVIDGTPYILWKASEDSGLDWLVSTDAQVDTMLYQYDAETGEIVDDSGYEAITKSESIDEDGKGTILWMKDEFGNECPYDFKNIMFKRWKATDSKSGRTGLNNKYMIADVDHLPQELSCDDDTDFIWAFTFSSDASGADDQEDYSLGGYDVYNNVFKKADDGSLPNNVFYGEDNYNNSFGADCKNNTFDDDNNCNSWGGHCYDNVCASFFRYNICGGSLSGNSFGASCMKNAFGYNVSGCSLGNSCSYISCGSYCSTLICGNNCSYITLGNGSQSVFLAANISYATVFEGVSFVQITTQNVKNVQVLNGIAGTFQNKLTLGFQANKAYTQVAAKNSNGQLVIYVPGDVGGGG